jgi:hypothetical protein
MTAPTHTGGEDTAWALRCLKKVIKGAGCLVFLDGRNEHGTHILPHGTMGDVDWEEVEKIELENDPAFTENVFKEAEAAGFKAGDWIWLDWRWDKGQQSEEGRWEIRPYWEYTGIDVGLSRFIRDEEVPHTPKPPPTPAGETPLTDAIAHLGHQESDYICRMTEHARQLEQALADAKQEVELLRGDMAKIAKEVGIPEHSIGAFPWNVANSASIVIRDLRAQLAAHQGKPGDAPPQNAPPQ